MAILHRAELTPSKPQLLAEWVPRQSWFAGDPAADPDVLGAPRLDDPDGEVGIETALVRFGDGPVLQVPLTFRGAPLDGIEPVVVMEHSVLGRRWVYDATTDPVAVAVLVAAIAQEQREAVLVRDGEELPSRGSLRGIVAGTPRAVPVEALGLDPGRAVAAQEADEATTVITLNGQALRLWRRPRPVIASTGTDGPGDDSRPHLVGSWPDGPVLLLADMV